MFTPLRLVRLAICIWLLSVIGSFAASTFYLFSLSSAFQLTMWVCYIVGFGLRFRFGAAATSPIVPRLNLPALPAGGRVLVFGVVALLVFFFLPPALRIFYPSAGGFAPDTVNAAALGAFHYFAALSMAYASWRWLFPDLHEYAVDCMTGKLLENLTDDLKLFLTHTEQDVMHAAERRHIAQFQFLIRCIRFVFALSPFLFFLALANHALTAALTAVPGSVPVL